MPWRWIPLYHRKSLHPFRSQSEAVTLHAVPRPRWCQSLHNFLPGCPSIVCLFTGQLTNKSQTTNLRTGQLADILNEHCARELTGYRLCGRPNPSINQYYVKNVICMYIVFWLTWSMDFEVFARRLYFILSACSSVLMWSSLNLISHLVLLYRQLISNSNSFFFVVSVSVSFLSCVTGCLLTYFVAYHCFMNSNFCFPSPRTSSQGS